MNVLQVYEKFSTPKNLREHMLRVAALAKIILDIWIDQTINKDSVIKACALHDIAKPVNFDITKQVRYGMSFEEIAGLEKIQNFIKDNYGVDEHEAAVKMCKDVGMEEFSTKILENMEWVGVPHLIEDNNIESLLAIYCDMRIGPKGILSVQERVANLNDRRGKKYPEYLRSAEMLEPIIKDNVNLDLSAITDQQLNSLFDEILNLEF